MTEECSPKKGNQRKETAEGNDRKYKSTKKEKKEKFLELLQQERNIEDPFERLSGDKINEIYEAIGRKKELMKEIPPEQLRLNLKKYYYKIKLKDVKQELKERKHSWKNEKKHKTLHEESSDTCGSVESSLESQNSDVSIENQENFAEETESSWDMVSEPDNENLPYSDDKSSGNYHKSVNQNTSNVQERNNTSPKLKHTTDGMKINSECDVKSETMDQQDASNQAGNMTDAASKHVENILSKEEIDALSNRQLKEILCKNAVDCKGICERKDLLTLVQRLWEYNQQQPQDGEISLASECTVCRDARIDCAFLECGHLVTCIKCGQILEDCPVCRTYIARAVHIFRR